MTPVTQSSIDPAPPTRRRFLSTSGFALLGAAAPGQAGPGADPIIDIHQHLNYSGRSDAALLEHQIAMGATTTILLPSGRPLNRPSTHEGKSNGLDAQALGNEACREFAGAHPAAYRFAANEVPDIPDARAEIERYLRRGAIMIAEQKFGVECDSPEMQRVYALARDHGVPVLMHWQFEMYNKGFERFHRMLEKYSTGALHRPRADLVGERRQEPRRPEGAVPQGAGHGRRPDRPLLSPTTPTCSAISPRGPA